MNATRPIRLALAALLASLALHAGGQESLEVIPLRHRTVEQVLPALRPLLEPGGVLTGQYSQLIVRTSPANLAQIKQALEAIDRPLRRLQISVRFDNALDAARQGIEASGRIGSRGSRVEIGAQDERGSAAERVDQRIQVLEGGHAFIATGRSTAMPITRDTAIIRETATGFEAVPRLAGNDTVLVDIAPQRETLAGEQQRLVTTVNARLGEWFELGAAVTAAARDDRGIASTSRSQLSENRRVW